MSLCVPRAGKTVWGGLPSLLPLGRTLGRPLMLQSGETEAQHEPPLKQLFCFWEKQMRLVERHIRKVEFHISKVGVLGVTGHHGRCHRESCGYLL